MQYFDAETVAREAGISADQYQRLAKLFAEDEPNDPMLAELHTVRACMAIKDGRLTIQEALADAQKLAA